MNWLGLSCGFGGFLAYVENVLNHEYLTFVGLDANRAQILAYQCRVAFEDAMCESLLQLLFRSELLKLRQ